MGLMDAVKVCFSKYATFSGRAGRAEYWYFALFYLIVTLILSVVEIVLDIPGVLTALFALVTMLPSLAVAVRRLHDTGRSGWWVLLPLIPLIGWILLLIWLAKEGDGSDNAHGPGPLAVAA